ncbi:MAG: MarP family serine protease [Acidimicrobiales bacterium]
MDILDWIVIVVVVAAAIHGLRLGAAVQVLSFAGALVGLVIGVALVGAAAPHVHTPFTRTFVSLLLLLLPCGIVWGIGRHLGVKLWGKLQGHSLAHIDAAAGAAIAVAGTLVFCWLVAAVLINSPVQAISSQIQNSAIIQGVSNVMPQIPSELASVERLLNENGFPIVLQTGSVAPVSLPSAAAVRSAVSADGSSTVQVTAYGCANGTIVEKGSGFVVAPGLVVTNAHVVAGSNHIVVTDEAGYHDATAIYFDPKYDLSVLRVANLMDRPVRLDPHYVTRGAKGAVLGFPLGLSTFRARPAGVLGLIDATGLDIYGNVYTTREMYEIQSLVEPGNSGGPLVEPNGLVIGVVFSRQASNSHIGYALASPGVIARVHRAERQPAGTEASTGACLSG